MRFSLRVRRSTANASPSFFLASYASRGTARLVPVRLGPGFFLYTLKEYVSPSRTCIRTHWDMWDHWDHPHLSTGCWSHACSSVPLSTGTTRR